MNYQNAIAFAERKGYFELLNGFYESVPKCTGCISCKSCCSESVNMSYIEFLNILRTYYKNFDGLWDLPKHVLNALLKFEIFQWTIPMKCPFLDHEGYCMIYEARPLSCRVFGTRSKESYERNYDNIAEQNYHFAAMLYVREEIVPLPALVERKIPFCEIVHTERFTTDEMYQDVIDQLTFIDSQLHFSDMMPMGHFSKDLVGHFMHKANELFDANTETKKLLYGLKTNAIKELFIKSNQNKWLHVTKNK